VRDDHDSDDPLVAELRTFYERVDPVPPLVREAAKAALGWRRLDADLAELLSDSTVDREALAYARGARAPARSVTFSAGEVTIDIEIRPDGESRTILGQLSPPYHAMIEIKTADESATVPAESDRLGRFRAQLEAGGPIRLRVVDQDRESAAPIETSWIVV
jgi:hypothetical protein